MLALIGFFASSCITPRSNYSLSDYSAITSGRNAFRVSSAPLNRRNMMNLRLVVYKTNQETSYYLISELAPPNASDLDTMEIIIEETGSSPVARPIKRYRFKVVKKPEIVIRRKWIRYYDPPLFLIIPNEKVKSVDYPVKTHIFKLNETQMKEIFYYPMHTANDFRNAAIGESKTRRVRFNLFNSKLTKIQREEGLPGFISGEYYDSMMRYGSFLDKVYNLTREVNRFAEDHKIVDEVYFKSNGQ